ncbi:MAG: hypothetical protein ABIO48_12185 [Pedococcus sp.]
MRKLSEQTTIWAVLGTGLLLRILLAFWIYPGTGFRGDMRDFASWADTMATHGPSAFYANAPTANYPPIYPLVLWPIGALTPLVADVVGRDAVEVGLVLSKVPAVVADLGIALLLLTAGRRWWSPKVGIGAAALFLVAPVTWYDSAVWGQVDSVAALPVLGSLVLLIDRRPAWAMTCATAAILVKPQSAVVLGVLLPVLVRRHLVDGRDFPTWSRCVAGMTAVLLAVCVPFDLERFSHSRLADVPVAGDVTGLWALYRSAGETFDVLSVNAYNAWALVGPRPLVESPGSGRVDWTPDSLALPLVGGISAFVLGALLLGATGLVVAVPLLVRRGLADDPVVVLLGHVVLAAAFFSVPTRVHERYLFPVFVSGVLLAVLATRWVISYAVASLTATVNLHAVLTGPVNPTFEVLGVTPQQGPRAGTGAIAPRMPTELDQLSHAAGTWSRSLPVATAVSALHALFFLLLLGSWAALVGRSRKDSRGVTPSRRSVGPPARRSDPLSTVHS